MTEALYTHNAYHIVYDSRQEMLPLWARMGTAWRQDPGDLSEMQISVLEQGKKAEENMIRKCAFCGKEFDVFAAEVKRGGGKYCSRTCFTSSQIGRKLSEGTKLKISLKARGRPARPMSDATREKISESNRNRPMSPETRAKISITLLGKNGDSCGAWKGGKIKRNCLQCGKEFERYPSRIRVGVAKFCSKKCANKYNVKFSPLSQHGSGHPNWLGGISFEPYCPKFTDEFKERVRAFFGYRCVECGIPQNGKKLHVHHVNFRKDACCAEDVIPLFVSLCDSCHGKTNHNRPFWQYWFTEMINHQYGGKCYLPKEPVLPGGR